MEGKLCQDTKGRGCGHVKPLAEFCTRHADGGRERLCRKCMNEIRNQIRSRRSANPISVSEQLCAGACGRWKPATEFARNPTRKTGLGERCKSCVNAERRTKYDPIYQRWRLLKQRYNIVREDFEMMWNFQCGVCPLCNKPLPEDTSKLHVDHCHVTGQVRGILHMLCNWMLRGVEDKGFHSRAQVYLAVQPVTQKERNMRSGSV